MAEIEEMKPFSSIGISCGGPLDEERGIIMSPPNLPGWDNIPIVRKNKKIKILLYSVVGSIFVIIYVYLFKKNIENS